MVRLFIAGPGAISLFDVPWVPFYLGLAFMLHPWLGASALGGGVVFAGLLVINELHSRRPALATTAAASEWTSLASDAEANAESIIAMGMLGAVTRRWSKVADNLARTQQRSARSMARSPRASAICCNRQFWRWAPISSFKGKPPAA